MLIYQTNARHETVKVWRQHTVNISLPISMLVDLQALLYGMMIKRLMRDCLIEAVLAHASFLG